jgi:hypothetical protein
VRWPMGQGQSTILFNRTAARPLRARLATMSISMRAPSDLAAGQGCVTISFTADQVLDDRADQFAMMDLQATRL